jgi:hypothetical protein
VFAEVAVRTRIFKALVGCGQQKCPSGSFVRFAVMAEFVKGKSVVNHESLKLRSTKLEGFCYFFIIGKSTRQSARRIASTFDSAQILRTRLRFKNCTYKL